MKKFLMFVAAAAVALAAMATAVGPQMRVMRLQPDGTYAPAGEKATGAMKMSRLGDGGSGSGSGSADEEMCTVRCVYTWNPDVWMLEYMNATDGIERYDGEYHPYDYTQGPDPVPVNYVDLELPAGTYDFVGQFSHINKEYRFGSDYLAFCFKERVSVTGNMTIEFDPSECVNELKVVTYNPNGEETRLNRGSLDASENYTVTEQGNISMMLIHTQVHHDYLGPILGRITEVLGDVTAGDFGITDGMRQNHIYTNTVSDLYTFRQIRVMAPVEYRQGTYVAAVWQRGSKSGTLTNDKDSYRYCPQTFTATPAATLHPAGKSLEYTIYTPSIFSGIQSDMAIGIGGSYPEILNMYCSRPSNLTDADASLYCLQGRFTEAGKKYLSVGQSKVITYTNIGGMVYPFGDAEPMCRYFPLGQLRVWPGGSYFPLNPFPGNVAMANGVKAGNDVQNCSTAPVLVGYVLDSWDSYGKYAVPFLYTHYTGAMGEERKADAIDMKIRLYAKDKLKYEGPDALVNWMFAYKDTDKAPMRAELENGNFTVDGLKGGNSAVVTFDLTNTTDCYPPTVTMLRFADAEGTSANRFATAADATLHLTAVDVNCVIGEEGEWGMRSSWGQLSRPSVMKVEIAPYGTEAFVGVAMTEKSDMFDRHGFGSYYTGSLAGLAAKGEKGWFDLRITLEDAAGNKQVQTVAAAVNIASLATANGSEGIEGVEATAAPLSGPVYNLQGICVADAYTPATLRTLPRGLYIVAGRKVRN